MLLGWRAKIGQIRPATAIEGAEEWRSIQIPGVAYADARTIVPEVSSEGLKVMMKQVVEASRQLATSNVDLIVQCGAPGTFLAGPEADQKVMEEIYETVGIPAITMHDATIRGLKAVGAKSVALGTIYTPEVNEKLAENLEYHGFKVSAIEGLDMSNPYEASTHDIDSAYKLGRRVHKAAGNADTILISCGTYRTFGMLKYLEMDTEATVITSNQATLWHAFRTLGMPDKLPELGKLWSEF